MRWRTRLVTVPPAPALAQELLVCGPRATARSKRLCWPASGLWADAGLRDLGSEIVRLGLRGAGIRVSGRDSDTNAICSHHVSACVLIARPELAGRLRHQRHEVWPELLAAVLTAAPGVRAVPVGG